MTEHLTKTRYRQIIESPTFFDGSWRSESACLSEVNNNQADPYWWFPNGPDQTDTIRAKEICNGCPVRLPCLSFAIKFAMPYGVWGGYTYRSIRSMRRKLAKE